MRLFAFSEGVRDGKEVIWHQMKDTKIIYEGGQEYLNLVEFWNSEDLKEKVCREIPNESHFCDTLHFYINSQFKTYVINNKLLKL